MAEMTSVTPDIALRGPGSLVHRWDGDGWGPSGCMKCGWRGMPVFVPSERPAGHPAGARRTGAGEMSHECPVCEVGPQIDAEHNAARVKNIATAQLVGRNDPCPCGSGAKFKKCCGR